jgi:predicted Zn-dependent peptidase
LSAAHQVTRLDSGVRVVTEAMPSVRSVALGLWVGTGSRDETPDQAGVSHFLEHLLFKGTANHSATEIAEIFDGMGASYNAATSKETTQLHARFLDAHTERGFELMAEMLLGPTYPEVDSERAVVLEEIAMYEDEPMDRVHDVLGEAVFGDHPLGRRVIGRSEVIAEIPVPQIAEYHHKRYVGPNIVVGAAGNLEHQRIVELAERLIEPSDGPAATPEPWEAAANGGARAHFYPKETEQFHICFGGPGISRDDDRRWALSLLDAVFGGSTSSRLFQEVREKRGLAYSVGSYTEHYREAGMVAMYLGTRGDNVEEACEIVGRELARIATEPVTADELERAREHSKGRLVLALESTAARMSRIAKSVLFDIELLTVDEMLAKLDAVTVDDLVELGTALYAPGELSAACVGPDEDRFRAALRPVSEALAAA